MPLSRVFKISHLFVINYNFVTLLYQNYLDLENVCNIIIFLNPLLIYKFLDLKEGSREII